MIARLINGLAAAALLAYATGLVLFHEAFPPAGEEDAASNPVVLFVVATLAVSLLHVGACVVSHRAPPRLWIVLLVAGAARLLLVFGGTPPILEGDAARLRFDARLTNLGANPYAFPPIDYAGEEPVSRGLTREEQEERDQARAKLLASDTFPQPTDVAHPHLRCAESPLTLEVLALGDRLNRQNATGFAFVFLLSDALTVFLLLCALRTMRLPLPWVMVYAWSPVLLKETYSTMAPGLLALPAIAGLVLCIARGSRTASAIPVALAAALRPVFLFLLPVFVRRMKVGGFLLFLVLFAAPYVPMMRHAAPPERFAEGTVLRWRYQEYNSLAENVGRGLLRGVSATAENSLGVGEVRILEPGDPLGPFAAKLLALLALIGVVTYVAIRLLPPAGSPGPHRDGAFGDLVAVLAAMVLLGPTVHPWHALWLLPVVTVRHSFAWLALPAVLCLSYLTHIEGPREADLTMLDGKLSFRAFEYGLFAALLALDLLWRRTLFTRVAAAAPAPPPSLDAGSELDAAYQRAPRLDEDLAQMSR